MSGKNQVGRCVECPFSRKSIPGWLGSSGNAEDFLKSLNGGETRLPCHLCVDWNSEDLELSIQNARVCEGYLIYLRNQMKAPRNIDLMRETRRVTPNRDSVFSSPGEFIDHHD